MKKQSNLQIQQFVNLGTKKSIIRNKNPIQRFSFIFQLLSTRFHHLSN